MSHVLKYDGQYFRVDVTDVANADEPEAAMYISWCSDGFRELKDLPRQVASRLVPGEPLPKYAEALRRASTWIKTTSDAQIAKRTYRAGERPSMIYTVWLFKGDSSTGYEFDEFSDAKTFAGAAEISTEITKVGITDNESPQYLSVWEKAR